MPPERGQYWTHIKTGHRYKVLGVAINATKEHDNARMVIYRAVRGSETRFVREIDEFERKFRLIERV